jgi:pimeloyl-ACP methyl ester carboxylesterase
VLHHGFVADAKLNWVGPGAMIAALEADDLASVTDITAPTLVLAGDRDPLAARPEVLAGAIPDARVAVLCGDHFGTVTDPRFASLTVDLLAGRGIGTT